MTKKQRETYIERWAKYIIPAVFRAEDKVRPQWEEKLRGVTNEDAAEVAEAYCRAIATEIVDGNKE